MYTNTSCTIYLKSMGYGRIHIPECFLTHRKITTAVKTGLSYQESAFCMILGNSDLVFTEGHDFLIEGNCDLIFDQSSEQAHSESIKALKARRAFTVMIADRKDYGSVHMRHWELSCK